MIMRFTTASGFSYGMSFFEYLRDTLDVLYDEDTTTPKMITVALQPRIISRLGRLTGLVKLLDHIGLFKKIKVYRRLDIAEHWYRECSKEYNND